MRLLLLALAITISALSFGWPGAQARADQGDIEVTSLSAESHYPNGMTFHVSARSSAEIDEVRVYFRKTGRVTAGTYREVEFQTTSPDSTGSIPGGSNSGGFPGSEPILLELENGPSLTRVGIQPEGRAPVRAHSEIVNPTGEPVGEVSSGSYGPTVGRPIAMGYVRSTCSAVGTDLRAIVRGKPLSVKICPLPFIKHNYRRH